ncbi:MAG: 2-dehydropantoate 2-reductase [Polyangiaceae bacterium]|nr:2-dehydropantoate 2-reductase [Polyangiaceae bacterium]MCW5789032.1 2-dehydropantoate 2-reductase [Polyangiaceae bacterium]
MLVSSSVGSPRAHRSGRLKIGVYGAGAIGGYLGLRLGARAEVTLVGRPWLANRAAELCAVDLEGQRHENPVRVTTDAAELAQVDVCLVTVKGRDTAEAGSALARVLRPSALVVSFQNGLRNAERLRAALPAQVVAPGMVTFNVVVESERCFRQTTSGPLCAGRVLGSGLGTLERLEAVFGGVGLPLTLSSDIGNLQAGKLLLNLNNGICAATGLSIQASLLSRPARRAFSACILEGHEVLVRSGRRPARVMALPPTAIARLLTLPDAVFVRAARPLFTAHPSAKSSTLQDLERGRVTEIDELSGEIVRLADEAGLSAPANTEVCRAVTALTRRAARAPLTPEDYLTPEALLERIQRQRHRE